MLRRRLIVCFDGTWNTPDSGSKPTNVVKLLRAVRNQDDDVSQICFYDKGVGTGGPIDRLLGGASGKGLTNNMVDGYRFLANNAGAADEIYIFGFSRGAYTARSLVGFIGLAGLLSPLDLGWGLEQVMLIYRARGLSAAEKRAKIDQLGLSRRTDVGIRCVGVWDTVGSLGIPGDFGRRFSKKYYFQDVQLSDRVDVALHAMAIDEKRGAFAPTLWVRDKDTEGINGQIVEQVWFSGVHSNVGGSYPDSGLSDTALDWMIKRVADTTDLKFDDDYVKKHIEPSHLGDGIDSRTILYKSSVVYPYRRLIQQCIPKGSTWGDWFRKTVPSMGRRNIPSEGLATINERVHISALERWNKQVVHDSDPGTQYRPGNLKAALEFGRSGGDLPVVGWDGRVIDPGQVDWPS